MKTSLLSTEAAFLSSDQHDNDVAISSRVRLARNFQAFPFPRHLTIDDAMTIWKAMSDFSQDNSLDFFDLRHFSKDEKNILVEKHLISKEFLESEFPALVYDEGHQYAIMVNEEDHLRIQGFSGGLTLKKIWSNLDLLDDKIGQRLTYAYDDQFGYLTSCPSNLGTGLRASVMLHLPLHDFVGESKNLASLSQMGIALRGAYGEGSQATGHFYQISNQRTLGRDEEALIDSVENVAKSLIERERFLRSEWVKKHQLELSDRVSRAFGILSHARLLSEKEAIEKLSLLRLGKSMGIFSMLSYEQIDRALLGVRDSFVSYYGSQYENKEKYRADKLRELLS